MIVPSEMLKFSLIVLREHPSALIFSISCFCLIVIAIPPSAPVPGDVAAISNFSNQKEGLYNDFPFCLDIRIPLSEYSSFINAYSLSIDIENKEELALLGKFKQLEYLNLIGPDLTDDEIEYVKGY